MTTATLDQKTTNYKREIAQLEEPLRSWDQDFLATKYVQISEASDRCYHSFNELQISITGLKSDDNKKKYHLKCYKNTYEFLVFIENEVDTDFCLELLKESEPFRRLFSHYSKYCTEVERKYDIELESERLLKANKDFLKIAQEYIG